MLRMDTRGDAPDLNIRSQTRDEEDEEGTNVKRKGSWRGSFAQTKVKRDIF